VVADELNLSRSATKLYLSQPALSRPFRALERLVGCDLARTTVDVIQAEPDRVRTSDAAVRKRPPLSSASMASGRKLQKM
jgi:hypothetical protein